MCLNHSGNPINGFVDDYAFLIQGLLDLYEASLDTSWLELAEKLQDQQDHLFWDKENSAYFTSPEGDTSILIRDKEGKKVFGFLFVSFEIKHFLQFIYLFCNYFAI